MLNMDQKLIKKTGRRKNHQNWYRRCRTDGTRNGNTDGTDERYHTSHRI